MSELDQLRSLVADVIESVPAGDSEELWSQLEDLGLTSVGIDEMYGGSGGSMADLAAVAEALGRGGRSTPLVAVNMARWLLSECEMSSGTDTFVTATLTAHFVDAVLADDLVITSVPWGRQADAVVVIPVSGRPVRIVLDDDSRTCKDRLDLAGSPSDTITMSGVADRLLLSGGPQSDVIVARIALLRAASLVGAVRGTYELTRDYVRTREQFGAPLVAIPAVAAGLARIRTRVIEAEAALQSGLNSWTADQPISATASMLAARVVAAASATETARLAHQLHGAVGVTEEYPLHRLSKCLWAWRDADLPEADWARTLAGDAVRHGEDWSWSALSVAG